MVDSNGQTVLLCSKGHPRVSGQRCPTCAHEIKTRSRKKRMADPEYRDKRRAQERERYNRRKEAGFRRTLSVADLDRFISKIEITASCWEWRGHRSSRGYGFFSLDMSQVLAHRLSYQVFVGVIPDKFHLDHLCENPNCVNPDHLFACSPPVHRRRHTSQITHCPKGHLYDEANTYITRRGERSCRECHRMRAKMRVRP